MINPNDFEVIKPDHVVEFYQNALKTYHDRLEDANILLSIAYKMTFSSKDTDERYALYDNKLQKIVLIAVRNKPLNLVIGPAENEVAVKAFAQYFGTRTLQEGYDLSGIVANSKVADIFTNEYFSLVPKKSLKNVKGQHLHALQHYQSPEIIPSGKMVEAEMEEKDMVIDWFVQFAKDCGLNASEMSPEFVRNMMEHRLSEKAIFFWKIPISSTTADASSINSSLPVAMIMKALCTESMYRIASVYTPAAYRGNHYASILTSTLSKQLLDEGKTCILFTDEKNPISNHIYEKIGYRIIAHHVNASFGDGHDDH